MSTGPAGQSTNLPKLLSEHGVIGTPTDDTNRVTVPQPSQDGRHVALEILRRYLSLITWNKDDGLGGAIPFKVALRNILTEWPDYEKGIQLPTIAIVAADPDGVVYDWIGNVPIMEPDTEDKFQRGTAVYVTAEHQEDLKVVIWAKDRAERRCLIAGLQVVLNPIQEMSGIRFKMKEYFDQIAIFSLEGGGRVEDEDATKNRRRAELTLKLRFNIAFLVNAVDMLVETTVDVGSDPLL